MRLTRYLNEAVNNRETLMNFFPEIMKNCKPYIKDLSKAKYQFLYRGVRSNIRDYKEFKSHVKSGRSPRDMPIDLHNTLNDLFKKKFGWYVRNGVSTTGESKDGLYGPTYIVFPTGNYQICWSPNIGDLYTELEEEYDLWSLCGEIPSWTLDNWVDAYENDYGAGEKGEWYYKGKSTGLNDIEAALADLKADGIEADESDLDWVPEIEEVVYMKEKEENALYDAEQELKGIINSYTKGNLKQAIESKNEVMVNCDTYYLVDKKFEKDIVGILKASKGDKKQMELFDLSDWKW